MSKWNDNIDTTLSFRMEVNEEGKAYFDRMLKEMKDKETAIRERIEQLFGEYVTIDGEKKDEACQDLLKLFAIGYQLGWNDHYSLFTLRQQNLWKPSDEQMLALEAKLTIPPQSPAMTSALIELYEQLKKLREE